MRVRNLRTHAGQGSYMDPSNDHWGEGRSLLLRRSRRGESSTKIDRLGLTVDGTIKSSPAKPKNGSSACGRGMTAGEKGGAVCSEGSGSTGWGGHLWYSVGVGGVNSCGGQKKKKKKKKKSPGGGGGRGPSGVLHATRGSKGSS